MGYVVGPDWTSDFIVMNGEDGFTLNGGGRIYFANKPSDSLDADMYWQTPLMDMHFAYNIDLSNVGCLCNAAGYFIGMPGPTGGEGGDWHCDANFVGGQWCPEYDCLESNKYTVAGTLHTCTGSPGNWNDCDRGGYCSNMAQSYNGMVFSASLWGGNGINMDWLDGMTGCGGECNIGGSSVTFSGFELW